MNISYNSLHHLTVKADIHKLQTKKTLTPRDRKELLELKIINAALGKIIVF